MWRLTLSVEFPSAREIRASLLKLSLRFTMKIQFFQYPLFWFEMKRAFSFNIPNFIKKKITWPSVCPFSDFLVMNFYFIEYTELFYEYKHPYTQSAAQSGENESINNHVSFPSSPHFVEFGAVCAKVAIFGCFSFAETTKRKTNWPSKTTTHVWNFRNCQHLGIVLMFCSTARENWRCQSAIFK